MFSERPLCKAIIPKSILTGSVRYPLLLSLYELGRSSRRMVVMVVEGEREREEYSRKLKLTRANWRNWDRRSKTFDKSYDSCCNSMNYVYELALWPWPVRLLLIILLSVSPGSRHYGNG
ncbi:hypothetical protein M0802_009010 [Mischocyttarus mexicanus]|nr:hypothetical protein M0802_009010 [Mischocyttarus mexicanus]